MIAACKPLLNFPGEYRIVTHVADDINDSEGETHEH